MKENIVKEDTNTRKEAPKKNTQQWLQSLKSKPDRVQICKIVIFVVSCFVCFFAHDAAFGFNKNECVSRLVKEIDPPYRLSPKQATERCDAIAHRIAKLSKQIIGKWQHRVFKGKIETMDITADGTAKINRYFYDTRQLRDVVKKWAFENPYGTVGEEILQFNGEYEGSVKFSGTTMTITSQPATATIVERWTRVR
jgi:hypothetical protein